MNSMVSMEIKRCNFLPEGEMAIIKDTNTLIHNIVDSELKEKDKEIERLNNVINELEKDIIENEKINNGAIKCSLSSNSEIKEMEIENTIYDNILDKLYALKEGK